jgi:hypothetical protein
MRFAYADPPYLGNGKKRYKEHPEAHIWDEKETHFNFINRLVSEYPDGWVLSCNPSDLRWLLPACPDDCRVGAWVKTFHQIRRTSTQYAWEPVIFRGGRPDPTRKPMVRDWISCVTTRKKGTIGAKPDLFNEWVLALMGYDPSQDTLDDIFPGSNGMMSVLQRAAQIDSVVRQT